MIKHTTKIVGILKIQTTSSFDENEFPAIGVQACSYTCDYEEESKKLENYQGSINKILFNEIEDCSDNDVTEREKKIY